MNVHDTLHVALYEAKLQRRQWEFRLFALVAIVAITLFQMFLQGQGYCNDWKMVALPCSVPFVNAYLFCVIQSFFVIIITTDFPRREGLDGALEPIYARPVENGEYTWGRVLGNMMLFFVVNVVVMLCCIFFVNLNSMAPLGIRYYMFYFITLNIPSLIFVMGLSLWLSRVIRWRYLTLILLFVWCLVSIIWLPYRLHGILDFLGTGVPNLFSDVTGHVGLGYYLLHRLGYLLLGLGFLFYSVRGVKRLPGNARQVKHYTFGGVSLVILGLLCGVIMAMSYIPARNARESYRESFCEHWKDTPCHVSRHDIVLKQEGEQLEMQSDLTLCNLNDKEVGQPLLFLNPGLRVTTLEEDGQAIPFTRDEQMIILERAIKSGDTLRLRVRYSGKIDERFTDLQLSDDRYEDSFRLDNFFPTGRRSAFVSDDYLLMTSACGWYPTALPPVNPIHPIYSGKDMTLYSLTVAHPRQRELFSQGIASVGKDSSFFRPSHVLSGISLCGGQFETRELDIDSLKFVVSSFGLPKPLVEHFEAADLTGLKSYFTDNFGPVMRFADLSWYESEQPRYRLIETPLPFRTEFNEGRMISGQVEPGMLFLPEKGFDLNFMRVLKMSFGNDLPKIEVDGQVIDLNDLDTTPWESGHMSVLISVMGDVFCSPIYRHPFFGRGTNWVREYNLWNGMSLFASPRLSIYSERYPFVGFLIDKLYSDRNFLIGNGGELVFRDDVKKINAYMREHNLEEALRDPEFPRNLLSGMVLLNVRDFVNYLGLKVSVDSLFKTLDETYHTRSGMISFGEFSRGLDERLGGDMEQVFEKWIGVYHDQYFKVTDFNRYFYPDDKVYGSGWVEIEGKVMNCGKEGGFVFMDMTERGERRYYSCYVEPGKAKAFYIAHRVDFPHELYGTFNTGMSANRPNQFEIEDGERNKPANLQETPGIWADTDISVFESDPNEIVVDDMDEGFSLDDRANQTILQKWLGIKREETFFYAPEEVRHWLPVIGQYQGDSIRSAHFKSLSKGNCSVTWTARLKEQGKYRVMVKADVVNFIGFSSVAYDGYTLYYTVKYGNRVEEIELDLKEAKDYEVLGNWMHLGEFDFPAGEVSVTLSDKDEQARKESLIVADAVKWVKIPEN